MTNGDAYQGDGSPDVEIRINDQCEPVAPPTAPTKVDRARFITQKLREGVRHVLHGASDDDADSEDGNDLFKDAAFNPSMILGATPHDKGSVRDKLDRGAKLVVEGVKNPRRAVRSRYTRIAAAKVSKQPRDLADIYDEALLEAHEALLHAKSSPAASQFDDASDGGNQSEVDRARRRVDDVQKQRNSQRGAWILGRHVVRAKVVHPVTQKPMKSDFREVASTLDQTPRTQWIRYVGHFLLWYTAGFTAHHIDDYQEPPFDLRELAMTVERLAVISTPWQSFLVGTRRLYRWDNPRRTSCFLFLYCILWYYNHIMTFAIAWGIFFVVRNKFDPTSIKRVREKLLRARDEDAKAQAWGEMIQRHGDQDWVEPLLDEIGPLIQMQLGDLASFLEILTNFYRWERPPKTAATLVFFATCFLLSLLTSSEFCAKLFWLGVGGVFFGSFPISARYPRYRHVVNPVNWVFWDIPNSAELAIIQLQEKAVIRDAARKTRYEENQRFRNAVEYINTEESADLEASDMSTSSSCGDSEDSVRSARSYSREFHQGEKNRHRHRHRDRASSTLALPALLSSRSASRSRSLSRSSQRSSMSTASIGAPLKSSPMYSAPLTEAVTFRAVLQTSTGQSHLIPHIHSHSHCRLTITRAGIWIYNAHQLRVFQPYGRLLEIRKIDLNAEERRSRDDGEEGSSGKFLNRTAKTIRKVSKWTALQFLPSGLEFTFLVPDPAVRTSTTHDPSDDNNDNDNNKTPPPNQPAKPLQDKVTLVVSESHRSKIFSLVLSWSNLKWQPYTSMDRQNKLSSPGGNRTNKGSRALDDALKMALK